MLRGVDRECGERWECGAAVRCCYGGVTWRVVEGGGGYEWECKESVLCVLTVCSEEMVFWEV